MAALLYILLMFLHHCVLYPPLSAQNSVTSLSVYFYGLILHKLLQCQINKINYIVALGCLKCRYFSTAIFMLVYVVNFRFNAMYIIVILIISMFHLLFYFYFLSFFNSMFSEPCNISLMDLKQLFLKNNVKKHVNEVKP